MSVGAHSSSNSSTRCKKPKKAISWPRILVTPWALKTFLTGGGFRSRLEAHSEYWLVAAANSVWPSYCVLAPSLICGIWAGFSTHRVA